jgi:hypothetical protein
MMINNSIIGLERALALHSNRRSGEGGDLTTTRMTIGADARHRCCRWHLGLGWSR